MLRKQPKEMNATDEPRSLRDLFVEEVTILFENRGWTADEALDFVKAFDLAIDGGCGNILFWMFDPEDADEVSDSLEIWAAIIETVKTVSLLLEMGLRPLLDFGTDLIEVGGGDFCLRPFRGLGWFSAPEGSHHPDDFVVVNGDGETMSLGKWIQTTGLKPKVTGGEA